MVGKTNFLEINGGGFGFGKCLKMRNPLPAGCLALALPNINANYRISLSNIKFLFKVRQIVSDGEDGGS